MRKLIILLIILFSTLSVSATECTDYLCDVYSKYYDTKVKIKSKEEFINKYDQKVGEYYISSVAYGFGYMKRPKCKKQRITYITILDENCNPIWGYVIPR